MFKFKIEFLKSDEVERELEKMHLYYEGYNTLKTKELIKK